MPDTSPLMAMTTTETVDQARSLARRLVEAGAAACVQIVATSSTYVWDGDVVESAEQLLLIKTTAGRWDQLAALVEDLHDYDTPELIRVDISGGSPAYLTWLAAAGSTH